MATLRFNGTSSKVTGTGNGAMNGALSIAVLVKLSSVAASNTFLSTAAASAGISFLSDNNPRPVYYNDNYGSTINGSEFTQALNTTDWFVVGVSRSPAVSTPRLHAINSSGGGSWAHVAGSASEPSDPDSVSGGAVTLGAFPIPGAGTFDWLSGDMALVAWWNATLTDAQFRSLTVTKSIDDWVYHSVTPASVTPLTSTSPVDEMGLVSWTNSGATAVGAMPPGWNLTVGTGPGPMTPNVHMRLSGESVPSIRKTRIGGEWV